jgi:hypothetical protein
MRLLFVLASAAALAACSTSSEAPRGAARVEAAPVTPVTSSALPPVGGAPVQAAPGSIPATSSYGGGLAPGARESAGLSNVSRISSGGATSGNGALGGTIMSGQNAGTIPSVVDRNRTLPSTRSSVPRDPLGPGTPPPVVAPELRDTTGNSLRNRQSVEF